MIDVIEFLKNVPRARSGRGREITFRDVIEERPPRAERPFGDYRGRHLSSNVPRARQGPRQRDRAGATALSFG